MSSRRSVSECDHPRDLLVPPNEPGRPRRALTPLPQCSTETTLEVAGCAQSRRYGALISDLTHGAQQILLPITHRHHYTLIKGRRAKHFSGIMQEHPNFILPILVIARYDPCPPEPLE